MAIFQVANLGQPVLRQVAKKIEKEEIKTPEEKGITATVFINPEFKDCSEETEDGWEGCLSLKNLRGIVPRHQSLTLEALDRLGKKVKMKLSGFSARVLQHEVDHLDGKVFVDRMRDMSTLGFEGDISAEDDDPED